MHLKNYNWINKRFQDVELDVHNGDAMLFTFVSDVETGGVYTVVLNEQKEDTFQVVA